HLASRDTLKVHPRNDKRNPLMGVFATRSPDRPNPLGLHRVTVQRIDRNRLLIGPIEAIDGTPVVDIKPVLSCAHHFSTLIREDDGLVGLGPSTDLLPDCAMGCRDLIAIGRLDAAVSSECPSAARATPNEDRSESSS